MKAQAAMEFLSTYGWAILVVLGAIGVLINFGVLDPAKLLPEKCVGEAGFECLDNAVIKNDGSVEFITKNNMGKTIQLQSQSVDGRGVVVKGGSCGDGLVADPDGANPAVAGDMLLSHGASPGEPTTYLSQEGIAPGELIRIKIQCPNSLSSGRFDDHIEIPYTSSTGLLHWTWVSIKGKITS
jgi:hypothetical protein